MRIPYYFRNLFLSYKYTSRSAKTCVQLRSFSVKELPWCTTRTKLSLEDKREKTWSTNSSESECLSCNKPVPGVENAPKFCIIAALEEKTRIIGIAGKLPWDIPEDREYFTNVTRDKVLIIGRKTFYETSDVSHLTHLRHVIVVSGSMKEEKLSGIGGLQNDVKVACTFEEALVLGKVCQELKFGKEEQSQSDEIDCWIGGGQLVFEKALRHPDAVELRLTTVHTETDVDLTANPGRVAIFPAKYRWDNTFKEISELKRHSRDVKSGLGYTFSVYQRR